MKFKDVIERIWSIRVWIVIALAIVAGLAAQYGVNSTARRPDPHGSAIVAMAVSKAGDFIASVDVTGELRFTDLSGRAVPRQGQVTQPRRLGALHPILDSNFATIDMAGNASLFSGAAPAGQYQAKPLGTYLASAVNANDLIAIAIVRYAPQQQQQQQQVQPARPEYFVDFQAQGELSLPARPTVLAPYAARPTRALFPNNSTSQPFLIGFADGSVGIITMQSNGPKLGRLSTDLLETAPIPIQFITSSEDGDIASVDTAGRVRLWEIDQKSESLIEKITAPAFVELQASDGKNTPMSIAFSPDGARILIGVFDNTAHLWDNEGKELAVLDGHGDAVESVAFSPDGSRIATASRDKTARLWDAQGNQLAILEGHQDLVGLVTFSPDGRRVLTASRDNTARLWDDLGKEVASLRHEDPLIFAAFSPDGGRIVTTSMDTTARLWDASGQQLFVLRHPFMVTSAAFNPGGDRVVTVSRDGKARIWDVATGNLLATLEHGGTVISAVFASDGTQVMTVSQDGSLGVWQAATGTRLKLFAGDAGGAARVTFSPDRTHVATTKTDGTVTIRGTADGVTLTTIAASSAGSLATYSPDGTRLAATSEANLVRVWRLDRIGVGLCRDCVGAWFFGNRLILATGDGRGIGVDIETGLVMEQRRVANNVTSAVPDIGGPALALNTADGKIHWITNERSETAALGVHADAISAVVKLPDSRVALGFLDGTIEIVDPDRQSWVMAVDIWPETREIGLRVIRWVEGLWPQQPPVQDDSPPETGAAKS